MTNSATSFAVPSLKPIDALFEAHVLWHQALSQYQQPMHFQANLNGTIQALRNITFVIQSEKHAFNDFDAWYAPWQERMKAEPPLRWLRDARTAVVKQGELETSSTAIIKLVTWRDHVLGESSVPPEMPPELILRNLPLLELINNLQIPPGDVESAAVIIERCWSTADLEGREILDALGQAYGFLSDLVFDAHTSFRETSCVSIDGDHPHFRSAQHRTGTLACMALGVEDRTQTFKLSTGEPLQFARVKRPVIAAEVALAAERYGFGKGSEVAKWQEADPLVLAERVLFRAKRILRKDRYHARMMFIRDSHGTWNRLALDAENRTEKHLLMRMVARFVESVGADAIIEVGEAWALPETESAHIVDLNRLHEAPGRKEILHVLVATRDGLLRAYDTQFTRGLFGGIKLGETKTVDDEYHYNYLAPILQVWSRQGTATSPDGKRVRKIWEPDPLDTCYCGGPNRFGECCKPLLKSETMRQHIQRDIDSAMAKREFARAEELARAALAQYVIWVRQHTAPTMHVARDLHRQLVEFDVPALDAYVRQLAGVVVANKHSDSFLPQLRHISRIIAVPELSVRVTALAAQWLFDIGDPVAASKELESLGDLENVRDTLALTVATQVFDWPTHKRTAYLTRAASGAFSDGERLLAELALAEHLFASGEREKALQRIESVIRETSGMTIYRNTFVDALVLRWRVSRNEEDFQAAKNELKVSTEQEHQQRLAIVLIDHGDFDEVQTVLLEALAAADPVAQLLSLDAQLRAGRGHIAREALLNIAADDLPARLRYPYAVAYSHVALACDDREMKKVATTKLRQLPSAGTLMARHVKDLLDALAQ